MSVRNELVRKLVERTPLASKKYLQQHRIKCPLCLFGYALVAVDRWPSGEIRINGVKDTHKCVICEQYFKLKVQLQITGIPIMKGDNHG